MVRRTAPGRSTLLFNLLLRCSEILTVRKLPQQDGTKNTTLRNFLCLAIVRRRPLLHLFRRYAAGDREELAIEALVADQFSINAKCHAEQFTFVARPVQPCAVMGGAAGAATPLRMALR